MGGNPALPPTAANRTPMLGGPQGISQPVGSSSAAAPPMNAPPTNGGLGPDQSAALQSTTAGPRPVSTVPSGLVNPALPDLGSNNQVPGGALAAPVQGATDSLVSKAPYPPPVSPGPPIRPGDNQSKSPYPPPRPVGPPIRPGGDNYTGGAPVNGAPAATGASPAADAQQAMMRRAGMFGGVGRGIRQAPVPKVEPKPMA
jgi:hypothetical protein